MSKPGTHPTSQQVAQKPILPPKLIRKTFMLQKFINLIIILRIYLTKLPLWIYSTIILVLFFIKVKRQGNLPTTIFLIVAILFSIVGEAIHNEWIYVLASAIAAIGTSFSYRIYCFPRVNTPIGFRQDVLENDLYMLELYPIKKNPNVKRKVLKWNHGLELEKMAQHQENTIFKAVMPFLTSAITKYKLIFAEGDEQECQTGIVWSHGRTATPLLCSQILVKLMSLQQTKVNLYSVQHSEKRVTGQTSQQKIKKFRELQVQARAAQLNSSIEYCSQAKKRIILAGHSYGCATVIQAYHSLSQQIKSKVSHIVLLDPWLYPLTEQKLQQQIKCPVLVLANEYFVQNQDVYNRNLRFVQTHSNVTYMVWKKGDHLHQTDIGFILGNTLGKIKHPQLCLEMLDNNIQAIRMFVQHKNINQQTMRQTFESLILPIDHKPQQWTNYLSR